MLPAIALAYAAVFGFGFIGLDDGIYIYRNLNLRAALSTQTLGWLLLSFQPDNWFPVTRLSLLADYKLFGLRAEFYHAENVMLHAAAALLLYAFLRRATSTVWPAAFAAFVFALHPLHVESVAWISERKDVLCALYWFATLLAWVRYKERPGVRRYLAALALFGLGLMAKPMIVSLPFLLVLLDVWPLRRAWRQKLAEKVPFLGLSLAVMAITVVAQRSGGAIVSLQTAPLLLRAENALVTVTIYIGDALWPARLWADYAYPQSVAAWKVLAAVAAISAVSAAVLLQRNRRPYLVAGWFWFLIALIPVIGLVQVGQQGRADRYMYVPLTGLTVMLAWGAAEAVERWPSLRRVIAAAGIAACAAMAVKTARQVQYWKDTDTLLSHSIAMDSGDDLALNSYGYTAVHNTERVAEATEYYRRALAIRPDSAVYHSNLGYAMYRAGRLEAATAEFREAARLDPAMTDAWSNVAETLNEEGRQQEALRAYEEGLLANPRSAALHNMLGAMLWKIPGRQEEGLRHFEQAVALRPDFAGARTNLGTVLLDRPGRLDDAVAQFEAWVRIEPGSAAAHRGLAGALDRVPGMEPEAGDQREEADRLQTDAGRVCSEIRVPIPDGCN